MMNQDEKDLRKELIPEGMDEYRSPRKIGYTEDDIDRIIAQRRGTSAEDKAPKNFEEEDKKRPAAAKTASAANGVQTPLVGRALSKARRQKNESSVSEIRTYVQTTFDEILPDENDPHPAVDSAAEFELHIPEEALSGNTKENAGIAEEQEPDLISYLKTTGEVESVTVETESEVSSTDSADSLTKSPSVTTDESAQSFGTEPTDNIVTLPFTVEAESDANESAYESDDTLDAESFSEDDAQELRTSLSDIFSSDSTPKPEEASDEDTDNDNDNDDEEDEEDDDDYYEEDDRGPLFHRELRHPLDDEEDTKSLRDRLKATCTGQKLCFAASTALAALLILFGILQFGESGFTLRTKPGMFLTMNLLMFLFFLIFSYQSLLTPWKKAAAGLFSTDLLLLPAAILAIFQTLAGSDPDAVPQLYGAILLFLPTMTIWLANLTELWNLLQTRAGYERLLHTGRKISVISAGKDAAINFTGTDAAVSSAISADTIELKNFFTRRLYNGWQGKGALAVVILCTVTIIVATVLTFGRGYTFKEILTILVLLMTAFAPFSLSLLNRLATLWAGRRLLHQHAILLDEEGVSRLSDTDVLVLDDRDLFPPRAIQLCGIKMYGSTRIDELIMSVTGVFAHLHSPLSSVLMESVDGENIIKPVSELKFYNGIGIQAFTDTGVLLIGTREFMRTNRVTLPSDGVEEKILESGRQVLFVAENRHLSAIISLKYTPGKRLYRNLRKLSAAGVDLCVRTFDPVITPDLIADRYDFAPENIRVVLGDVGENTVLQDLLGEESHTDMMVDGQNTSAVVRGILAALRCRSAFSMRRTVYLLEIILSVVLICLFVFGSGGLFSPAAIALFQLIWSLPALCATI